MRSLTWQILGSLAAAAYSSLLACGAPRPASAPAKVPGPQPVLVAGPRLEDRSWGVLRSKTLGLKLALPEARNWLTPETAKPTAGFWELRHEPTGSTLSVRRWRSARLPRPELCELELRQRVANIPNFDETNLVATRQVRVPEGFVMKLTLLSLSGVSARLRGQVVAVGAGVGECLAAIASTDCASEEELAERLRLFDAALRHVRLSHIEDRIPRPEPLPR
ncbi:MAG TPA: hypothetical protein VJN18_07800 [Polyangiaceae bacterium]|nr:hypothetical protein [Polyangiaceae bacterium]